MKHLADNNFNQNRLTSIPDGAAPQEAVNKRQLDSKANVDGFNIVQVKDFGSDWDAVKAAWAVSKHIELERGVTYEVDEALEASGEDVTIVGNGAKLNIVEAVHAFELSGGWDDIQNISSVGAGGISVTVANASNYNVGDVVKVVSEQTLPAFTANCRRGEFTTIASKSGNTIVFNAPLRLSYSTGSSPRIGKLSKAKIRVSDVVCDMQRGYTDRAQFYPPEGMIAIEAALEPVVENIKTTWNYRDLVLFRSCYGFRCTNIDVDFSANMQEGFTDMVGYGIRVSNSESGIIDKSIFRHSRHGVVFIGSSSGGFSGGLTGYGEAAHNICSNSIGMGCTNSPFDTHHGSFNNKFISCSTYSNKRMGYQARGIGTVFENCSSYNDDEALSVFVQSSYVGGGGLTDSTRWVSSSVINPRTRAFRVADNSGSLTVDGGFIEISNGNSSLLNLYRIGIGSLLQLSGDHTVNCYGDTSSASGLIELNNSVLRITSWFVDYTGTGTTYSNGTTGNIPLIKAIGETNSSIISENVLVRTTSATGHFTSFYEGPIASGAAIGSAHMTSVGSIVAGSTDIELQQSNILKGPFTKSRDTTVGNALSAKWMDWTPTYSGSGSMTYTNVTTNHARYMIQGKIVYFSIFAIGTTGGSMNNTLIASLPVPAAQSAQQPQAALTRDSSSGASVMGGGQVTQNGIGVRKADGSNYTAGTGRVMVCHGFYEAG